MPLSVLPRSRVRARPDALCAGPHEAETETMGLTATARSIPGTLRQEVVIDGKHRLITDEPEHLGGEGSGPAPHELFPAALASCISTTLVMYARTKGWQLGEVVIAVDYDNRSTPRRFDVRITLGGELTHDQLGRLSKVAESCPVRRSVEAGIEFVETIELRGSQSAPSHLMARGTHEPEAGSSSRSSLPRARSTRQADKAGRDQTVFT
jgi:putative redox protein